MQVNDAVLLAEWIFSQRDCTGQDSYTNHLRFLISQTVHQTVYLPVRKHPIHKPPIHTTNFIGSLLCVSGQKDLLNGRTPNRVNLFIERLTVITYQCVCVWSAFGIAVCDRCQSYTVSTTIGQHSNDTSRFGSFPNSLKSH